MQKAILGVALATLMASPAFSQATPMMVRQGPGYANERAVRIQQYPPRSYYGYAQQGYTPGAPILRSRIYGYDPDRNVQLQLYRDPIADY